MGCFRRQRIRDAPYHILVIDDEKMILDVIHTALSRAGFKVEIALDGREGIKKFDSGQFDLVITDMVMPGIGGREVVEHIRNSDRPCTPIIGVSGTPWLFENIRFDAFFKKPFPLKDLLNSIRHLSMQFGSDCNLI
jgi:DNA-binding response OmpR family regulator